MTDQGPTQPGDDRGRWPRELTDVRERLDALFRQHSTLLPSLGGSVQDWGPGWAVVSITPGRDTAGLAGTTSNGVLAGLADTALEVASNSYGRQCLAIGLTAHHHAAAPVGVPLVAVARESGRDDRTVSYQIDIHPDAADPAASDGEADTESERVVATFVGQGYRTSRWHLGEDAYPDWWRNQH